MLVGAAHTDGPLLHEGQLGLGAIRLLQHGYRLSDGIRAALDGDDLALHLGGDHDLVEDGVGLLDGADDVAADDLGAGLHGGGKLPLLLPVQGRHFHAAGQVVALHLLHDDLQGTLDAVVDILNQAGAQLYGQRGAGGDHFRPGTQAGGLLVNLDGSGIAGHGEDLADQALLAHTDHVGHVGLSHTGGDHQRTGDLNDFSHRLTNLLSSPGALPLDPIRFL